jgi:tRNA(fMet)-specific endonuclease VapC
MRRFILDTDHVSLVLRGDVRLRSRVEQESGVCISVITFQEIFNGWIMRINQAKPTDDFVELYSRLCCSIEYLKQTEILNFDHGADRMFRSLLQQHPHLRKARLQRDMRIAAIALSQQATVVTRNHRDFGLVPRLQIVDWTIAASE